MPARTPQELELLALLSSKASPPTSLPDLDYSMLMTMASPPTSLPDLDYSMLMSNAGQRELAAAAINPTRATRLDEWGSRTARQAAPGVLPEVSLESIFMETAFRETGESMDTSRYTRSVSDEFDFGIEFDSDFETEGRTVPNEAARFQVGRQSPPRMRFDSQNIPTGGQVVSQRGPNGFQPVARPAMPERTISGHVVSQRGPNGFQPTQQAPAIPRTVPRPSAPEPPPMSRYQVLLSSRNEDL